MTPSSLSFAASKAFRKECLATFMGERRERRWGQAALIPQPQGDLDQAGAWGRQPYCGAPHPGIEEGGRGQDSAVVSLVTRSSSWRQPCSTEDVRAQQETDH